MLDTNFHNLKRIVKYHHMQNKIEKVRQPVSLSGTAVSKVPIKVNQFNLFIDEQGLG